MELIYGPMALDCMSMVEVWHNHGVGKYDIIMALGRQVTCNKISLRYMNTQ